MHQDILILLRLEEGYWVNIHFLQTGFVDGKDQAADWIADQTVDKLDTVYDLSLGDGRGDVNIPRAHAGEVFILREHAVEKGRAAAIIADDEERFFDGVIFVGGEEDFVQPKADPIEDGDGWPNDVEKQQKEDAFGGQAARGVGGLEPRMDGHSPKKAEVIVH